MPLRRLGDSPVARTRAGKICRLTPVVSDPSRSGNDDDDAANIETIHYPSDSYSSSVQFLDLNSPSVRNALIHYV